MKPLHAIRPITLHRRKQAGDALLDALIALVLASVVGLVPVYVASRGAVAQTQAAYQNMAVVEMRKLLAAQGPALCGTTPTITVNKVDATAGTTTAVINQLPVTVTCTDRAATGITIGGVAVDPTSSGAAKTVSLSVTSSEKFGGSGTITITQGGA